MKATFQILGNLTKDPELKHTAKGTAYTKFSIAVNSFSKESDGSLKQTTDFFNVIMWGNKAVNFCKYHAKGNRALIDGKLTINTWEDQQGNKRRDIQLIGFDFYFVNSKSGNENYHEESSEEFETSSQQDYEDDEVPF